LEKYLGHVATKPVVWAVEIAECEVVLGSVLELWREGRHHAERGIDVIEIIVKLVRCEICQWPCLPFLCFERGCEL